MTKRFKYMLPAMMLLATAGSMAQTKTQTYAWEDEKYPRERLVDIERMVVSVSFEPDKGLVTGEVTHYFKPLRKQLDSLFLDAPGIEIKKVILNGKPAVYKTNSDGLVVYPSSNITWDTNDSLRIQYSAHPRKGLYFIGWNDKKNLSKKQIWTQGQGIDNRYWIPMWDDLNDKMITETMVRFDRKYQVLSNGTKVMEKENKDGTKTWHYKMTKPHSSYLLMLGIGEYEIKHAKSKSGVPLHMYYYPEHKQRADLTYKHTAEIMDFFEREIGVPYPWESYSQIPVQDFMYGAMENTTATVFGDFFCPDNRSFNDRNYVAVNAHEMAHQWFGDMITARCEPHHWLQESFATHYNMLAEREIFGQDHYDWARRNSQNTAIDADSKDSYPVASSKGGTPRHYPKGAIVLHTLKYVTGREAFNRAIKHYLQKHAYKNVTSDDLMTSFEEATGISLGWFWEQWLYKAGVPDYKVTLTSSTEGNKTMHHFFIVQQQEITDYTGLFKMPVVLEVHYKDGSVITDTAMVEKTATTISLSGKSNVEVAYVLFDPGANIPKKINFAKSNEMLFAQALHAKHMIDRYDALIALKDIAVADKKELLVAMFEKENFHAIKAEISAQLIGDVAVDPILKSALSGKDNELKKAALNKLPLISNNLRPTCEALLSDSSYEVIAVALDKLAAAFPENTNQYLERTKDVIGVRSRNVELKRIEIMMSQQLDQENINKLVAYSGNSYEFQTRVAAMQLLKKFNYFDQLMMENCFDALFNPNSRLAGPAAEVLKHFRNQQQYQMLIDAYAKQKSDVNYQKEAIKKIQ